MTDFKRFGESMKNFIGVDYGENEDILALCIVKNIKNKIVVLDNKIFTNVQKNQVDEIIDKYKKIYNCNSVRISK